ncbi:DUF7168 domain-containing protein [Paramagnetospirillum magneticum]|uniref:DUF7168 domain-containing protein n=1 Tax=Paramagnetospirillum magneticum TaxID=84159 RepID=UPI0002FD79E1|nr:DUF2786 domain-containing protein [Paramagnetospirillum magneticum]
MRQSIDNLRAKIHALRAKTIANGCTEAEALAAAEKVADLLDRNEISIYDVDVFNSQCGKLVIETGRKTKTPISACIGEIALYCNCKVWAEKREDGVRYIIFGLNDSIEAANYVHDIVLKYLGKMWGDYKDSNKLVGNLRSQKSSYQFGMAVSIAHKLNKLKSIRDENNRGTGGSDLVLARHAIVEAEFAKLQINLRRGKVLGKKVFLGVFGAGQVAGQSLTLHEGVQDKEYVP